MGITRMVSLLVVSAGVAAAITDTPPSAADRYPRCGNYVARGELYTNIRAKRVGCTTARAVVRGWADSDSSITGWRRLDSPRGWRCRYRTLPVRFQCLKDTKSVRFDPGPGF